MYKKLILIFTVLFLLTLNIALADTVKIGLIYSEEELLKLYSGEESRLYYRNAIEFAGGRVVVLAENYDEEFLQIQLEQLDGLLIPGGGDIDPSLYGEEMNGTREPDIDFDKFEMEILEYCLEKKMPVMGICRGHQLINVYFGGTLYQDIPADYEQEDKLTHQVREDGKIKPLFHKAYMEKEGLLYKLLEVEEIRVNSTHHQAVKDLAPGFKITARSSDGIIEAMEGTGEGFIFSVQFHPERLVLEDPRFDALFYKLIEEAEKYNKVKGE